MCIGLRIIFWYELDLEFLCVYWTSRFYVCVRLGLYYLSQNRVTTDSIQYHGVVNCESCIEIEVASGQYFLFLL